MQNIDTTKSSSNVAPVTEPVQLAKNNNSASSFKQKINQYKYKIISSLAGGLTAVLGIAGLVFVGFKAKAYAEERKVTKEGERLVRAEAEKKAKEAEAEKKAKEEGERLVRAEAYKLAKEKADRLAIEEMDKKAEEEIIEDSKEEKAKKSEEKADRLAIEKVDKKAEEEIIEDSKKEKAEEIVTIVIGPTGAGKSTLLNAFLGNEVSIKKVNGNFEYNLNDQSKGFAIGHEPDSKTKEIIISNGFVDTPGFFDTNVDDRLKNQLSLKDFIKDKTVRFIFVLSCHNISALKGQGLDECLDNVYSLSTDDKPINLKSIGICVTKFPKKMNVKNVIVELEGLKSCRFLQSFIKECPDNILVFNNGEECASIKQKADEFLSKIEYSKNLHYKPQLDMRSVIKHGNELSEFWYKFTRNVQNNIQKTIKSEDDFLKNLNSLESLQYIKKGFGQQNYDVICKLQFDLKTIAQKTDPKFDDFYNVIQNNQEFLLQRNIIQTDDIKQLGKMLDIYKLNDDQFKKILKTKQIELKSDIDKYLDFSALKEHEEKLKNYNQLPANFDLKDSNLGEEEVELVNKILKVNTTITNLNLSLNNLGEKGAEKITEALKNNKTLISLDLSLNNIKDNGAEKIAENLKNNKTLANLDLTYNHITSEGGKKISELVGKKENLTCVNLFDNEIGEQNVKLITTCLKVNMINKANPLLSFLGFKLYTLEESKSKNSLNTKIQDAKKNNTLKEFMLNFPPKESEMLFMDNNQIKEEFKDFFVLEKKDSNPEKDIWFNSDIIRTLEIENVQLYLSSDHHVEGLLLYLLD